MHRFVRIAVGALAVGLVGALALNVIGVIRLPVGPLGGIDEIGSSRQMSLIPEDGHRQVYTTIILSNPWPVPATLEDVRPILHGERGGAEILGAQPYDYATLGENQQLVLGAVQVRPAEWAGDHPVAGTQVPTEVDVNGTVVLVRAWGEPGATTDIAGYEIDYRVGPFAFRAISTTNSVVLCSNDDEVSPDCDDAEGGGMGRGPEPGRCRLASPLR